MNYKCKYLTPDGEIISEIVETDDINSLKSRLKYKGNKIIDIKSQNFLLSKLNISFKKELNYAQLSSFCNQMYFVLKSSNNLLRGLDMIRNNNEKDKKINKIINKIYIDVEGGGTISSSMKDMHFFFPSLLINMIMSGEKSGELSFVFKKMHLYYKKQNEIKNKIRNMLIQPIFLIVMASLMLLFFLFYVLPEMLVVLDIEQNQLPLLTLGLISTLDFLSEYYIHIVLFIITTGVAIKYLLKNKKIKYLIHYYLLKLPLINTNIINSETFRLSSNLELFLKSGLTITESISYLQKIVTNEVAKKTIDNTKKGIIEGSKFNEGLQSTTFFDTIFVKSVQIGEETGELEEVLTDMTIMYEEKLDESMKKCLSILEPALIIGIGIFIGTLIMSIALPIFGMIDHLM